MIGLNIFKNIKFFNETVSVIIGSVIYKACVFIAIYIGMEATDLKLITAILFLIVLILGKNERKERRRKDD